MRDIGYFEVLNVGESGGILDLRNENGTGTDSESISD
jgi:hypothetical protein